MCNKLKILLSTMKESDEPMTKRETLSILKACGEDMEKHTQKIENLEKKFDNLQTTQTSILNTQTTILAMVEKISKKLDDEKIEEKAYMYDQNHKVLNNWKFWVVFLGILMLAGAGVLKVLDKSDNIATISKAIK